jgi:hypothetical protein
MAYDAAPDAAEVTSLIADFGVNVFLNGSGTPIRSIVDERPDELAKAVPQDIYDSLRGRIALFYFAAGTVPAELDSIAYDNQTWTPYPTRLSAFADVSVMHTVLATAGGVH